MPREESLNIPVPISIPVLVPSDTLVETFTGELPATFQYLIDQKKFTAEEIVAFIQFRAVMNEIGGNIDEFANMYKGLKEALAKREQTIVPASGGIILPNGY